MMVVMCFASSIGSTKPDFRGREHLRSQIDQLNAEANSTRAKANTARLRFMRLSDSAERLKRQAAICVQSGREDEARELLFQKKKVMHALERTKARIQWLDELSTKLNQVISLKEGQLIQNAASDFDQTTDDTGPVRIVSPKEDFLPDECYNASHHEAGPSSVGSDSSTVISESASRDENICSVNGLSLDSFVKHIDEQLNEIEDELSSVLSASTVAMSKEEKCRNRKLQEISALLVDVQSIRQRISQCDLTNQSSIVKL